MKATTWSILNKLFDIAPEVLIGVAIDMVVNRQDSWLAGFGVRDVSTQLILLAVLTFFIWFFESFFEYLHLVGWRSLAQQVQHDLRVKTYGHVLALDLAYFEDKRSGDLVSIMNDDVNQLERFLDGGANSIIQTMTSVLAVGGIFFYLAPSVAVLAMIPIPVIILAAFFYKGKAEPLYANVRNQAGKVASRLTSALGGVLTIKAQTAELFELQSLTQESLHYQSANRSAIRVSSAFMPLIRMAVLAGFLATLVVGGNQALAGELPVGSYGVLVFLTQRLLWPLTTVATTIDQYQRAMASLVRIRSLLDKQPQIKSGTTRLKKTDAKSAEICFEKVSFSYPTRPQVITNFDLAIKPATMVALVGATGSGKSTLSKLLLRYYEPTSGRITLVNRSLEEYDLNDLRQSIGYVGQEHFMFDGTIAENITYGRSSLSREKIIAAARAAEASEFIEKLPQGFDTYIGERGQKLSGGQKQRLALARAIIFDPAILILDEATSAVDNETELLIQKSLARLAADRTVIVIAHRLSTIRRADMIHVIDSGRIAESGTHEQLLEKEGLYHGLWRLQSGEDSSGLLDA